MLAPVMRLRHPIVLALCLLLGLTLSGGLTACGAEQEAEGSEGEPFEVADLSYNIGLTRFLNPDDAEDAEYLVGQPRLDPGTGYLGVFLTIENETDVARPSASEYTVIDTLDNEYDALESKSPYALELAAEVPAEGSLPLEDTTAATGPNHGSLLIFLVDDAINENRPLLLEIKTAAGTGEVLLDI